MKRILTIRLALLIVCALSINTAFAQDVRQKPVVKKQPAPATTTKQTATGTKQKQVNTHKWEDKGYYYEGLAWVRDVNGKCGFIDKTGRLVLPCKWNFANDFNKGLAHVQDTYGNWVKIDKTGKVVR